MERNRLGRGARMLPGWMLPAWMLLGALVLSGPLRLLADPQDLKALDKTVFDRLKGKASQTVDITLDGSLIKMAVGMLGSDGDEDAAKLKRMVANLKSVSVRSFEFTSKGDYSKADLDAIRAQLHAPEWNRIVSVESRKDGENDEVYLLAGKEKPQGLFIISAEPLELTVVHIMGTIDVNDLAALENFGSSVGRSEKGEK